MTKPLKIWLWIVFIFNILGEVANIAAAIYAPSLVLYVVVEAIILIGVILLLFKQKKTGFYLLCVASVLGMILNIASGSNIAYAIVSGIVMPLIIWLLMRKTWNEFT